MGWSARPPVRNARSTPARAFVTALAAVAAVALLLWAPGAGAQAPPDSARAGAPAGSSDTTATAPGLADSAASAPPAGFLPADWETLSAGLPEEAHFGPIFNFRYNRVDGAALTLGGAVVTGDGALKVLYASFTYAFARERGLYLFGFDVPLGDPMRFMVGGSYYRRTWTWDQWIVGETENTIFGLVAQEDYRDYWESAGVEGHASWTPGSDFALSVSARRESQANLTTDASFAIFKKPDGFRANPTIDEGDQGLVTVGLRVGPATLPAEGGTNFNLSYSRAGEPVEGDFEYGLATAALRTRVNFGHGQEARARIITGSTLEGTLPSQQLLTLGGIGTLRGFGYMVLSGDQSFLANGEYYHPVRRNVYAFAFLDWGASWFGRDNLGRQKPSLDGGIGIRLGQGPMAITAARSLQSAGAPILIGVRLGGSF